MGQGRTRASFSSSLVCQILFFHFRSYLLPPDCRFPCCSVQLHQLAVNPVYFIPEREQIHERFLHLYFLLLILAQFAWNLKFAHTISMKKLCKDFLDAAPSAGASKSLYLVQKRCAVRTKR